MEVVVPELYLWKLRTGGDVNFLRLLRQDTYRQRTRMIKTRGSERIGKMWATMGLMGLLVMWCATAANVTSPGYSLDAATYGAGASNDAVNWSAHPCRRPCTDDGPNLTCRYGFTIERYSTMSKACYDCPQNITDCFRPHCLFADGKEKTVFVVNRQLPGPAIEVCKGDWIIVDVTNALVTETTTIHWHGLLMRARPWMDGVPFITQCPIMPGHTFRYDFAADIAGTFLWHSHSGHQRADGFFGSLLIRPSPGKNPLARLYDEDRHSMLVNEWTGQSGASSYVLEYQNGRGFEPEAILVNGLGYEGELQNGNGTERVRMPVATFEVKQSKRYRFRLLNIGAQNCPIHVSVDHHPLLVIATDGADIEPVEVDSIRVLTGERYDFVLTANQKVDNYWIRLTGDMSCANIKPQLAVLKYKNASDDARPITRPNYSMMSRLREGLRELNPFDQGTETPGAICIPNLNALATDDVKLTEEPDHRFYVAYDFYELDAYDYHRKNLYGYYQVKDSMRIQTLQLNNISFKMPAVPLLTQHDEIGPGQLCNDTTVSNCTLEQCTCTHTYNVRMNSAVEVVLIDKGKIQMNHPMHLHGYYYRVVAMKKVNTTFTVEQFKQMDEAGKIQRKLKAAPLKDTVIVPSGGYTIIRFLANNPGYWFFHCHFESHASNGMALVFKVGENKDIPEPPKDFPKC